MRISNIKIGNRDYPMCFSVAVMKQVNERFGSLEEMQSTLMNTGNTLNAMEDVIWLLYTMIRSAIKYQQLEGVKDIPELPDYEMFPYICDISDLANLKSAIMGTISTSSEASVSVEAPKNAETTQTM